jgi:uncharacterized protein (DUF58 family)
VAVTLKERLWRALGEAQLEWSTSPDKGSISPGLWELWRRRLTEPARLLLIVLMVGGVTSLTLVGAGHPLYRFTTFLLSLFVVSRLLAWILRPRLRVERALPDRIGAGATVEVVAKVTNPSRWPALDVSLTERFSAKLAHRVRREERPERLAHLPRGASAQLRYRLSFPRRGAYDLEGPQPETCFPFGLFRAPGRRVTAPHRMLVTPTFHPLARLDLPVGQRHQPGGLALVSNVGDSEEFVGNREYRAGDRLRDLDQRAWARVGVPIVREFQQEYLCRVALVVDTYVDRRRGTKDHVALEAGISLGAAVADALSRQEYVIDIFAAGPDLYHFMAGRSLAYLESILDLLACIEANPNSPFEELGPALLESISQISTAVAVFLDWDEDRQRFARLLTERGVVLKVLVVRDDPPTLDPQAFGGPGGPVTVLTPAEVKAGVEAL